MTFGSILREARERKGYDLPTAARRLRIRPDILRAIEEDDFSRMPPRGYARNMVNAYARLVGLNPTEMTRMYLDEAYAYQVGRARTSAQPSGFYLGDAPRAARARERGAAAAEDRPPHQNAFGRTLYDDRRDYRDFGSRANGPGRLYSEDRTHPSRHTALRAEYTNFYAGPKAPRAAQAKLPFIIAGAAVLVVLAILLLFAFGNKGGGGEDVTKLQVTGLADPGGSDTGSGGADGGAKAPASAEAPPTSVKVVYQVPGDTSAYVVVTTDGKAENKMLNGPVKESVDVTGTWSIATWIDKVTVTVDGKPASFDAKDASGMPQCDVDFKAYLDKWYADHPDVKKPADAAAPQAGSTTPAPTAAAGTSGAAAGT